MSRTTARIASSAKSPADSDGMKDVSTHAVVESRDISNELESLQLNPQERWGKSRRWGRRLVLLLIVAGVAALVLLDRGERARALLAEISENSEAAATVNGFLGSLRSNALTEVATALVESRDRQILSATGFIEAPNLVHLTTETPGTIVEVLIEKGTVIQAGDLCIRLEDARYKAELDQAKAALDGSLARLKELRAGPPETEIKQAQAKFDAAKSKREIAQKTLDRENRLLGTNARAQHEQAQASLEQATANVQSAANFLESLQQGARPEQIEVAEADVRRAEAALVQASYNFEHAQIRAPEGGTILEKNVELGQFVSGGVRGESLAVIVDLTKLTAVVSVSERDLSLVKVGQTCEITTEAFPDRFFSGRVDRLSPSVNRQRGVMEVVVEILDADETLLPDMNCSVSFLRETDEHDDTVMIPSQCLVEADGGSHVFVLGEENRVQKRLVRTGNEIEDDGTIEITEGLSEGEQVIVMIDTVLADGQQVTLIEQ